MISYQHHSLALRSDLTAVTQESLALIHKLDKKVKRLCKVLDEKLNNLNEHPESLEEIVLIKKTVEILTVRKVQLAMKSYDLLDQNIRAVDSELGVLQEKEGLQPGEQGSIDGADGSQAAATPRGQKRKYSLALPLPPTQSLIDPNEPVYCTCNCIAFGEMIACDNEECPTEWFHYACVGLSRKPRNSWLCAECSAATATPTTKKKGWA